MINLGNREITAKRFGNKVINTIYLGLNIIWNAISSCFGAGYWINDRIWKNEDCWKN